MRAPGTGTIEELPSGRFRPILPGRKGKKLPARDTRAEAEKDLDTALFLIASEGLSIKANGTSLAGFGRTVIERRRLHGYTNAWRELSRWRTHVERGSLGRATVEGVSRAEIVAWVRALAASRARAGGGHQTRRDRPLSRSVAIDALRIVRAVLREAILLGMRPDDPTVGVAVPKDRGRTHEPWTYLRPGEVRALLEVGRSIAHPEDYRAAQVALYTGLREGELWTLHARDVDLELGRLTVRYGGREGVKLRPTKGRRPRTLALLSPALVALREQIPVAVSRGSALVFPSIRSPSYRSSRAPRVWGRWARELGEREGEPPVTWHTLRHTFATLALAGALPGVEGEGWRLERVSAYLGHRSIAITQRYADVAALLDSP